MKKRYYFLSILILFLFNIGGVNAKVIDYQFMGKKVNESFTIASGSSLRAGTFINVTEDSTASYLVVDLCSNISNNITVTVPTDLDGSYTMFYKSYDLKSSCGTNSTLIRLFFNATTYADSGNGNMAINNLTNIYNNSSTNATFIVRSVGLSNVIDLGDLTINNQNTIINDINNINSSITNTEQNIKDSLSGTEKNIQNSLSETEDSINNSINNVEDSINSSIKDTFEDCTTGKNLWTYPSKTLETNNLVVKVNNNNININGTTGWSAWMFANFGRPTFYLESGTYTFSVHNYRGNFNNTFGFNFKITSNGQTILDRSVNNNNINNFSVTFDVPTSGDVSFDIYLHTPGTTFNNVSFNLQLEKGNKATSFEPFCKNRLDSLNDTQKETNDKLDNLNDNITDSDSSGASGEAGDFFSNFNTDTFGLTSIITAPLELIKSVTSKTCTALHGTLPFVSTEVNLPCLSTIYETYFGSFLTIYRTITFGFVSYWVCIKIFNLVKDFKNPEHDEIEVLDL